MMKTGDYVVVRSTDAGVHAGVLGTRDGSTVELHDARRLWRWKAERSISLSAVAVHGIRPAQSRIAPQVSSQIVLGVSEILATTASAESTIRSAPEAVQS